MKLCITEKPSVARDIARLLGANDKHEGYFEGADDSGQVQHQANPERQL